MDAHPITARFIAATFPSVWTLELLLELKDARDTWFSQEELIGRLRASEVVVSRGVQALSAAGLVQIEGGRVRYMPASAEDEAKVEETERLYRGRPNAVRRVIVRGMSSGLSAFSDAFKLRGE